MKPFYMAILSIAYNHGWKTWTFANAIKFVVVVNFLWAIFSSTQFWSNNIEEQLPIFL